MRWLPDSIGVERWDFCQLGTQETFSPFPDSSRETFLSALAPAT